MKTIRLGNDISIQWTITRLGVPEDFEGKNLTVQLIDKLGNPQIFDYVLQENVISGTFYGKDQVTNGTYRLLLIENEGEPYMVTLDYIDCFCLSNKMKNQTSNGSDTTSTINTEVIEVTSNIDLDPDLSQYVTKEYLDASYYDKDEIDEMISEIPALDTYTKSQIDEKIADVSNNIPTKVSDLDNDSGYLVQNDVSTFITEDDLSGYAKTEDIPTKVSELDNDEGYITSEDASIFLTENDVSTFITEDDLNGYAKTEDIPTKVSELDNDEGYLVQDDVSTFITSDDVSTFITKDDASIYLTSNDVSTFVTEDDLQGYAKTEDIPTKVSELDNDSGYLVQNDVSTFVTEDDLQGYAKTEDIPTKVSELDNDEGYLVPDDVSTFVKEDYLAQVATTGDYDDLVNKPTIPEVPTNVSAFTNDAGYLVANDVSTLVDESDLSNVAFSGDYGDLENKPDLTHYFDDAAYDSSTKRINFKHDNTIVAFIDATEFIKDGMVDNVVIENGYVVITFNTDAGKEAIRIPITDIFNPANYYDKTAIDQLLQGKQDTILDLGQIRLDASAGRIAYGWGNHAEAGYLVQNDVSTFVQEDELKQVAFSGDYDDLINKPTIPVVPTNVSAFTNDAGYLDSDDASIFLVKNDVSTFVEESDLATVATTGDYDDLINKPTIPASPEQSDWNESSTGSLAYIKNKPTIITLADVSSGFEVKAWKGTQAQYDALQVIEQNKLYIILPTT